MVDHLSTMFCLSVAAARLVGRCNFSSIIGREGGRILGLLDVCHHLLARRVAPRCDPSSRSFHVILAQGTGVASIKSIISRHFGSRYNSRIHQVDHFTTSWLKVQQSHPSSQGRRRIPAQSATVVSMTLRTPLLLQHWRPKREQRDQRRQVKACFARAPPGTEKQRCALSSQPRWQSTAMGARRSFTNCLQPLAPNRVRN